MPETNNKAEQKLEKLATIVRKGWAQRHPATQRQRDAVRQIVKQQWDLEQTQTPEEQAKARRMNRDKQIEQEQGPEQEQSH